MTDMDIPLLSALGNAVIPQWMSKMTGAQAFAQNPANGFQPTIGDALQGIGHSMMEHYRAGPNSTSWKGNQAPAPPPAGGPGPTALTAPPNPVPQIVVPPLQVQAPPPLSSMTMGQLSSLWR